MFLLTSPFCWVYARCAIAKSMDRFSSLIQERILPLCGFFYVRNHCAFVFRAEVWGAFGLAGTLDRSANPHLSARPCFAWVAVFPKP